jgi:hypothetical protein
LRRIRIQKFFIEPNPDLSLVKKWDPDPDLKLEGKWVRSGSRKKSEPTTLLYTCERKWRAWLNKGFGRYMCRYMRA